ncbi:hypothetical protein PhaeoP66_04642 (plasmid) [Phaeobacter inhibens]|uniref:Transcriptional regulator n=1 Tax=Phaeobacter inhibens TaxID=221822 RepID=A0ABN5GV83_9RHOB|nr:hypothetical protein [Phaeobacter inhibens]AUQ93834.1 hypothetical protein PhaeoP66_01030 [Phaeobacter inhibens]AUQ97368.1 hypothetical protein PhaeoP66_04642 [Phaeobacter inhibens]KXF91558.1 hypothetical protein AT574_06440 [Phaeobacter inhibens]UWR66268.1 hypothetical protein K4L02_08620 [Phaeobacter inhibens]WHP68834.1 hypothetical protein QMZ01_01205 [Phaeobacter inhibens]
MSELAHIEDNAIVIRIPKDQLSGAAYQGLDDLGIEDESEVDWDQLAIDMVAELNSEEEDGTTLVHRALDQALINAGENGSSAFPD